MNLENFQAKNILEIKLKHPVTGELIENGLVECYAPHTRQYKLAAALAAQKSEQFKDVEWRKLSPDELKTTLEKSDEISIDILESVIIKHPFEMNGKKVHDIRTILGADQYKWINDQINEALNDNRVFINS